MEDLKFLQKLLEEMNSLNNMKSIKVLFDVLQEKNVGHAAYISLGGAVKGRGYTRDTISRNFTELIPKDDYASRDREALIDHLVEQTKPAEEQSFEGVKNVPRSDAKKKVIELHKRETVELPVKKVNNNYYGEED